MDFQEKILSLAEKVQQQSSNIQTEEATKTAFILPSFHSFYSWL